MSRKHWLLNAMLLGLLACLVTGNAAATERSLLEMADEMDRLDEQDFLEAINKANSCTSARNFSCTERELAKAAKVANDGQDKKALTAARQNMANEKTRIAEEERREREAEERRVAEEEAAQERERQRIARQQEENNTPSTASQIAMFGQQFLNAYSQQLAAKAATNAVIEQQQQANRAAIQREQERNQQMLAAASRQTQGYQQRQQYQPSSQSQNYTPPATYAAQQSSASRGATAYYASRNSESDSGSNASRQEDERREQERRDSLERKRVAEAEVAKQKAEQERQARAEEESKRNYLSALERGINLRARTCPDGEGKHYIVGIRPKITPRAVDCVDVYYTETCPGSVVGSSGVIKNFLGAATDCFMGDTAEVSPTPACKPNEARVVVTRVQGGCGG